MKTATKTFCLALLIAGFGACKKTVDDTSIETSAASDTTFVEADSLTGDTPDDAAARRPRKRRTAHRLTQAEIDSIKAERDKIVTPPDNTGASTTPGSGRAVPSNNKIAPGNNASQGSSTGNVEVKK